MDILTNKKLPSDTLRSFTSKVNCKSVRGLDEINEFINDKIPDWVGISSINKNTSKKNLNFYLSVDNFSLHTFSVAFLQECLDSDMDDYDFKINNRSNINRRDNVVIYCNDSNVSRYFDIINKVIQNNPSIKFNSPYLKFHSNIFCYYYLLFSYNILGDI